MKLKCRWILISESEFGSRFYRGCGREIEDKTNVKYIQTIQGIVKDCGVNYHALLLIE